MNRTGVEFGNQFRPGANVKIGAQSGTRARARAQSVIRVRAQVMIRTKLSLYLRLYTSRLSLG